MAHPSAIVPSACEELARDGKIQAIELPIRATDEDKRKSPASPGVWPRPSAAAITMVFYQQYAPLGTVHAGRIADALLKVRNN
jgi:hypothetical protein